MSREEILAVLERHRREIEERHHVSFLAIFGSVARNEATAESDVDVLVDFSQPPGFRGYMRLKEFLEDVLGSSVDLVMIDALKASVRPEVEREAIRVA